MSLIAFLFSTVLVFCAFFVPFNGDKKASAYFVNESPASIGSVTFSDYADKETVFDATVLKKLYGKILGRTTASYQDLAAAISGGRVRKATIGIWQPSEPRSRGRRC